MEIIKSASKIVLLMLTLTLCVGIFTGKIDSGVFENALMIVLTFYFTREGVKAGFIK